MDGWRDEGFPKSTFSPACHRMQTILSFHFKYALSITVNELYVVKFY